MDRIKEIEIMMLEIKLQITNVKTSAIKALTDGEYYFAQKYTEQLIDLEESLDFMAWELEKEKEATK